MSKSAFPSDPMNESLGMTLAEYQWTAFAAAALGGLGGLGFTQEEKVEYSTELADMMMDRIRERGR